MMKTHGRFKIKRILAALLSMVMLCGNVTITTQAETQTTADPLKPADLEYEDGNIVLNKQAKRIGADEWTVNVKAEIKDMPVTPPKLEVAFVLDVSKSMKMCAYEEEHTLGMHFSHSDCPLICEDSSHQHEDSCYLCGKVVHIHADNGTCTRFSNEEGRYVDYTSRFEIAKQVIANMANILPEGTRVGRVVFGGKHFCEYWDGTSVITPQGETYLMNGVRLALNLEGETPCFTSDPTTEKILIIVTDGEATDGEDYGKTDPAFQNFIANGGIVYTVGFNHYDENLLSMVANGGTYSQASNPDELESAFDHIALELTAMLVDPMGSTIGFDKIEQQAVSNVSGELSFDSISNTLYWNPTQNEDISNSVIEYSYIVKLNDNADLSAGVHTGVPLNKPTSLLYGLKSSDKTELKSAAFPIPQATYAISTLQVQWMCGDESIQTATPVERVICDYGDSEFITDYTTKTPVITVGETNYYYQNTIITKNGEVASEVNISDAAAYVVTHQYSLKVPVQTAQAVVEFVDEDGNELKANHVEEEYVGSAFDVTEAEEFTEIKVGTKIYDFVSDNEA
ncbi:MAG: VWA domain-containing protein, partial [Firmicutes bacterium]|nr:VWA domain-containing protein [Bacillota bacterium]